MQNGGSASQEEVQTAERAEQKGNSLAGILTCHHVFLIQDILGFLDY